MMNKIILILSLLFSCSSYASKISRSCFIAKENNGAIIKQEGDCNAPYPPQSTFKIALSLMGFDSGVLVDEYNPSWALPIGADPYINVCKNDHNSRTWLRDSCLWYSRILTAKLGMNKFQDYVTKFNYGNMDLSGGLDNAWLSSSLKISPLEQIAFLEKIINHKLPVNKHSYDKTKKIMFIQELAGGWKLYGKTGNGRQIDKIGDKTNLQHGWFVGYIEKDKHQIVFASHLVDDKKQETFASFITKNDALIKLWYIIDQLEK